jgi:Right handed beta helix region
MTKQVQTSLWLVSGLLCWLLLPGPAQATTLNVNCNAPGGQLNTIGGALKLTNPEGPSTINVSGDCHENVVIQSFERLTLHAVAGASISDASSGANPVVDIVDSRAVMLQGFTINGGAQGILCEDFSQCRFQGNTIQNGGGGVSIQDESGASFNGDVIQNTGGRGLNIARNSVAHADNLSVNGNGAGIFVISESFFAGDNVYIQNNGANGVRVIDHSTFRLVAGTITGNGANGVELEDASEATFQSADNPISILSNSVNGVQINDLSFVRFQNGGPLVNVTGNGTLDVNCRPQFSATRGVFTDTNGARTNCMEP